ncbi:MAG: hypothetical protein WA133_08605 [Syntrophales bacterium]
MLRLEDLQPNAAVRGLLPDCLLTVVGVQWFGSEALELTYKTPAGKVANELLYRHDEPRLVLVEQGRPWNFDGDSHRVHYIRQPFQREPDFGVTSVNYDFAELLLRTSRLEGKRILMTC